MDIMPRASQRAKPRLESLAGEAGTIVAAMGKLRREKLLNSKAFSDHVGKLCDVLARARPGGKAVDAALDIIFWVVLAPRAAGNLRK